MVVPTLYRAAPDCAMDTPVSMGTSIMAVTYKGGVILGADSRTSTGSYVANRTADKVGQASHVPCPPCP